METLVILAAVAATLLACIFVATLSKGPRRPPLRLPREEEWEDDAEAVSRMLNPPPPSPIDRGAQVLDAQVVGKRAIGGQVIEGRVIEGQVVEGRPGDAYGGDPHGAGETRRFEAEELDSRMLDHLLDQQNRELRQAQERDSAPPSETKHRTAR